MSRGRKRAAVIALLVAFLAVAVFQGPVIRRNFIWIPLDSGTLETGEGWRVSRHRFDGDYTFHRGTHQLQAGGDPGASVLIIYDDDRAVEVRDDAVTWHAPRDWDANPLVPPPDVWVRYSSPTPVQSVVAPILRASEE